MAMLTTSVRTSVPSFSLRPPKAKLSTTAGGDGFFLRADRAAELCRPVAKTIVRYRNQGAVLTPASSVSTAPTIITDELESASSVVRKFYSGINGRDLASVEGLIAENCVYEDLVFPQPFVGRKAILEFFRKFIDSVGPDLQFVIDDISEEDSSAVGVTWHLEWKGRPFPFSKGCSFYRLEAVDGQRQILYGRDSVEPAIKPGETALVAIRGVAWLLQQFPQLAERL
nr:Polyketide cyclase SnoaL-like domain [Ipomoea batatas]